MDISADSLVCRPCRHDVTRVLADAAYVPRWQKGSTESASTYCCVHNCTKRAFSQASLCTGFLAFLRLVGTVYFKKHASGFDTPSPASHLLSFSNASNALLKHKQWISDIRQNIADRCTFDNSMLPSTEALYYHWQRSCWVLHMWAQSDQNHMVLEPITAYGWRLENDTLRVIWDTEENMRSVRERVGALLCGCKCMTGCKSRVCGCKRKDTKCTEGCQCTNCENQFLPLQDREDLAAVVVEEAVHSKILHLDEDEEEEFAEFVFTAALDTDNAPTFTAEHTHNHTLTDLQTISLS